MSARDLDEDAALMAELSALHQAQQQRRQAAQTGAKAADRAAPARAGGAVGSAGEAARRAGGAATGAAALKAAAVAAARGGQTAGNARHRLLDSLGLGGRREPALATEPPPVAAAAVREAGAAAPGSPGGHSRPGSQGHAAPATAAKPAAAGQTRHGAVAAQALRSFEAEADELLDPRRQRRSRAILWAAVLVVGALGTWAQMAEIDEVTKGEAKVISSRQLQTVQSLDGGVVSAILVREGQVVEAGQVLLKIDETRATSGARENAAQGFALQARLGRLRALAEGTPFMLPRGTSAGSAEEQRIVDEERRLYEMRQSELQTTLAINRQQQQQREQELSEARARRSAAERTLELSRQELQRTRPLLASGAVSEMDILKIDRDISRSRGEVEQTAAQIARLQAAIGEAQRKGQETELSFRNEARRDLADAMGKLNALNESAVALNDRVDKSQLKSPVRGKVQRLLANTVGGVVQPGKDLVEIVALDDKLVLEAKVHPRDIAFIHPGQAANVKFTAYDASIYGGLDAKVENISPDTVVDERGNAFYLVRVQTLKPSLGERLPIIPGMTAEVDVLTGRKTVMTYLLKPVLKVRQNALRER